MIRCTYATLASAQRVGDDGGWGGGEEGDAVEMAAALAQVLKDTAWVDRAALQDRRYNVTCALSTVSRLPELRAGSLEGLVRELRPGLLPSQVVHLCVYLARGVRSVRALNPGGELQGVAPGVQSRPLIEGAMHGRTVLMAEARRHRRKWRDLEVDKAHFEARLFDVADHLVEASPPQKEVDAAIARQGCCVRNALRLMTCLEGSRAVSWVMSSYRAVALIWLLDHLVSNGDQFLGPNIMRIGERGFLFHLGEEAGNATLGVETAWGNGTQPDYPDAVPLGAGGSGAADAGKACETHPRYRFVVILLAATFSLQLCCGMATRALSVLKSLGGTGGARGLLTREARIAALMLLFFLPLARPSADSLRSLFPCGWWSAVALVAWGVAFSEAVNALMLVKRIRQELSRLAVILPAVAPYLLLELCLMHFFATMGICAWGWLPSDAFEGTEYGVLGYSERLNFGGYTQGMVLLLHILSLNNWSVTAEAYVSVSGEWWPFAYLYFVAYIWCTVLLVLNVLNGALIELYATLQKEEEQAEAESRARVRHVSGRGKLRGLPRVKATIASLWSCLAAERGGAQNGSPLHPSPARPGAPPAGSDTKRGGAEWERGARGSRGGDSWRKVLLTVTRDRGQPGGADDRSWAHRILSDDEGHDEGEEEEDDDDDNDDPLAVVEAARGDSGGGAEGRLDGARGGGPKRDMSTARADHLPLESRSRQSSRGDISDGAVLHISERVPLALMQAADLDTVGSSPLVPEADSVARIRPGDAQGGDRRAASTGIPSAAAAAPLPVSTIDHRIRML
mmetsp:Transcript_22258/g.69504  ORF Transcript_22258/g.69504 Transcript_22258/m.69504 type:complete len:796 (+) Transcript_22258:1181-3568(+)